MDRNTEIKEKVLLSAYFDCRHTGLSGLSLRIWGNHFTCGFEVSMLRCGIRLHLEGELGWCKSIIQCGDEGFAELVNQLC